MQVSPPSTQQPSPSLRYTVQDSHRQSPDHDPSTQAVKLTLNQVDFFMETARLSSKSISKSSRIRSHPSLDHPAVGSLRYCAASIGSTT